jgi:hypothetical protein
MVGHIEFLEPNPLFPRRKRSSNLRSIGELFVQFQSNLGGKSRLPNSSSHLHMQSRGFPLHVQKTTQRQHPARSHGKTRCENDTTVSEHTTCSSRGDEKTPCGEYNVRCGAASGWAAFVHLRNDDSQRDSRSMGQNGSKETGSSLWSPTRK